MSEQVSCDQCGATARRGKHDGWISLNRFRAADREEILSGAWSGRTRFWTLDLCSWKCLGDYATLRLLDPQPEESA